MDIKSLLGLLLFFPTVSNAIEIPVLETFSDSIALWGAHDQFMLDSVGAKCPEGKMAYWNQANKTYHMLKNEDKGNAFVLYSSFCYDLQPNDSILGRPIEAENRITVKRGAKEMELEITPWRYEAAMLADKLSKDRTTGHIELAALGFCLSEEESDKAKWKTFYKEVQKKMIDDMYFAHLESQQDSVSFASAYLDFEGKNLTQDYINGFAIGLISKKRNTDLSDLDSRTTELYAESIKDGYSVDYQYSMSYLGGFFYAAYGYTPQWSKKAMLKYLKATKNTGKAADKVHRKNASKNSGMYQLDYLVKSGQVKMVAVYDKKGFIDHLDVFSGSHKMGKTQYGYSKGRNTSIAEITSHGYEQMHIDKVYDKDGNIVQKHRKVGHDKKRSEVYTLDEQNRMVEKNLYLDGYAWSTDLYAYSEKGMTTDSMGRKLTTDTVVVTNVKEGYLDYMEDMSDSALAKRPFYMSINYYDTNENKVKTVNFANSSKNQKASVIEWIVDESGDIVEKKVNGTTVYKVEYDKAIPFEKIEGLVLVANSIFDTIIDFTPKHAVTKVLSNGNRELLLMQYKAK